MLQRISRIILLAFCSILVLVASILTVVYGLKYTNLSQCTCPDVSADDDCDVFAGMVGSVISDETIGNVTFASSMGKTPIISFNLPVGKYDVNNIRVLATNVNKSGFDWNIAITPLPVLSEFLNGSPAPNLNPGLSWAIVGLQNGYGILKKNTVPGGVYDWYASANNMFGETNQAPVQFTGIPFVSQILLDKEKKPTILYVSSSTTLSALISKDNTGKDWFAAQPSTVPASQVQPTASTSAAIQDPKDANKMGLIYIGKSLITPTHAAVNLAWSTDAFTSVINYMSVVADIEHSYTLDSAQVESVVTKNGNVYVMVPSLHITTSIPVALVFVSPSLGDPFAATPFVVGDFETPYPTFNASWSLCAFGDVVGVYASVTFNAVANDTRLFLSDDNFVKVHSGIVKQTIAQSVGSNAIGVVAGDEWRMYVCNNRAMTSAAVMVYVSSTNKGATWSNQKNVLAGQTETDSVIGSIVSSQLDETSAIVSFVSNLTNACMTQIIGKTTQTEPNYFGFAAYV